MKKIMSMVLAIAAAMGLCLTVSAYRVHPVDTGRITLADSFSLGNSGHPGDLTVKPGDEVKIPLTTDLFQWSDGRSVVRGEAIDHLPRLYHGRVKLGRLILSGREVLDYGQLEMGSFKDLSFYRYGSIADSTRRTAYIRVKFHEEEFDGVDDVEFRYRIYLSINGQRYDELSLDIAGEFKPDVEYVDSKMTDYDLSQGEIIEAEDTVPNMELYLGNGFTAYKYLNKDTRYRAQAFFNDSIEDLREEWPELYPDVKAIYQVVHKNMDTGIGKAVLAPPDGQKYYVYNRNMEFVGMTGEVHPFSDIYFLSASEIPAFELENYLDALDRVPTGERAGAAGADAVQEPRQDLADEQADRLDSPASNNAGERADR